MGNNGYFPAMNFWNLLTLLGSDGDAITRLLADGRCAGYASAYARMGQGASGEGPSMDTELPDELCKWALPLCKTRYRLRGNWLSKDTEGPEVAGSLTALEVYERFGRGGEPLVWVEDLGAFDVTRESTPG
jgi:hypothetical protein